MTIIDRLLTDLRPVEGGWRVYTTETCHVDILVMAFGNLRIVLTELDNCGYRRGWCYNAPLHQVIVMAHAFDPDDPDDEPIGWIKEAGTERRACAGHFPPGPHRAYIPTCERCGRDGGRR